MAPKLDAGWNNVQLLRETGLSALLDGSLLDIASADPEIFLKTTLDEAIKRLGSRAKIRVLIDPSVAELPWETMKYSGTSIVLSPRLRIVRQSRHVFQEGAENGDSIRLLIVSGDPGQTHQDELALLEKEVSAVEAALQAGECRQIQTTVQRYCSPTALRRLLAQNRADVFHFVGHAEQGMTGSWLLLDGGRVFAEDLAEWLRDAGTRLAVFGGCSTLEFAGIVADAGITATIGFSGKINDAAAMNFARSLYASFAMREPLEESLLGARLAIQGFNEAWRQPVLFLASGTPASWGLFTASQKDARPARRHNLTYDARPFIGRATERSELSHRLIELGERLVTITGMGGMGKTRLSRQLTGELSESFADGAWFVECDGLESRQEIAAQAAMSLELEDKSEDSLKGWLENRHTLLVFDCFERVVSQADFLESLLLDAPGLSILVTSRIVLGLPREHEYQLPPMTLKGARGQNAESLSLFEEAGRHARRDFRLSTKDFPLARKICQLLEGVPLAIVLAAGRLRHVSLAELGRYIEERPLDILRATKDPSSRHGSLETVVGDSFVLIDEADRRNLVALSAFGGSFTSADAQVVLSAANVFDVVGRLKDNSLIEAFLSGEESRYKLLDSVRDYLTLVSADSSYASIAAEARDRHVDLMLDKGQRAKELTTEGRWQAGMQIIQDDLANFRAAIRRALSTDNHVAVRAFARHLALTFFESGMWGDFEMLATAALASAREQEDHVVTSSMLSLLGALAGRQKNEERCRELWMERAELCERENDIAGLTDTLTDLAWQAYEQADLPTCRRHISKALRLARAAKNYEMVATCLVVSAQIAVDRGELAKARKALERTDRYLALCIDIVPTLYVLQVQILTYGKLEEPDAMLTAARRLVVQSMESHRHVHLGWAFMHLAQMYEARNETDTMVECAQAALKLHLDYASRYLQRAKALVSRLKKEQGESAERRFAETNEMSWRHLANLILAKPAEGEPSHRMLSQ
jgi:predicted ATPase